MSVVKDSQRRQFVLALVALVQHLERGGAADKSEADELVMDIVEAADVSHEEFQVAVLALQASRLTA